jgi:GNAT superfamily N-acetyltransferase
MSLKLRKATASDAASLTGIYFSAFSVDAISLLVFPRNESSYKFWHDMIIEEMAELTSNYVCIYDSSLPSQPVVAFAKWNSPSAPPPSDELQTWPIGSDSALANHFFGNLLKKHKEIMGERKHWYLELVAARPDYQGKGAAGQLLRWGLERADEDGVETFLEASPDGRPIYEHFGFWERDRLVVKLEGNGDGVLAEKEFVEVFMVRGVAPKMS